MVSGNTACFGSVLVNLDERSCSVNSSLVHLTNSEIEILRLLIEAKGRVVTRSILSIEGIGRPYFYRDQAVDRHITRLRATLGIKITSVRNKGYILAKADEPEQKQFLMRDAYGNACPDCNGYGMKGLLPCQCVKKRSSRSKTSSAKLTRS